MASSRPKGRPTKLTKIVQDAIVESVSHGNYFEVAARAAGISPATFYNWKARGEEGGGRNARYVEFLEALTRAEAEAEAKAVQTITQGMADDPRLAVEYLKRKAPGRWSATERLEHTGAEGGPIKHERTIDPTKLSQETLDRIETETS